MSTSAKRCKAFGDIPPQTPNTRHSHQIATVSCCHWVWDKHESCSDDRFISKQNASWSSLLGGGQLGCAVLWEGQAGLTGADGGWWETCHLQETEEICLPNRCFYMTYITNHIPHTTGYRNAYSTINKQQTTRYFLYLSLSTRLVQ